MIFHPIFNRYRLEGVGEDERFLRSITGARTRREFEGVLADGLLTSGRLSKIGELAHIPHHQSEDYYEWIDLLEAIDCAGDRFTMVELGAGYGRWITNGYLAVQRHVDAKIRDIQIVGVEASQKHFDWMKLHLQDNDLVYNDDLIVRAAISSYSGYTLFPSASAGPPTAADPGFGLAMIDQDLSSTTAQRQLADAFAEGVRVMTMPNDQKTYDIVPTISINDLLSRLDADRIVDLIDMDVQGAEFEAVAAAIDVINLRVKRMHIGTHSRQIDRALYDLLVRNGWRIKRFFHYASTALADFGPYEAGDGIISCTNCRFANGN